ncbi:MAG: type II secretion system F family protein [Planctomycetes bacterium]|nr:type II secretion system F family protein [Planctomycetota bacterium]
MFNWQIIRLFGWGVGLLVVVGLLIAAKDTVSLLLAGESMSVTRGGFGSRGRRLARSIELQAVIGHLAVITRLNLPIHSALRAAAKGESRRIGKTMTYMAYLVETGWPASEALGVAFKGCARPLADVLRQGEQCGQFPQAVADAERMLGARVRMLRDTTGHGAAASLYAVIMMLFCGFMLAFVAIIIMPRFWNIFNDFGIPLPAITRHLLAVMRAITDFGGAILLMLALVVAVVTWVTLRARRGQEDGFVPRTIGTLRSWIPFTRAMDFGFGMSSAIRALAMGLRGGAPLDRAVTLVSVVGHANFLRSRLDDFSQQVKGGVLPHKAAAGARLGDVFVSALKMAERGEDVQTAFRHAADYYEATARRWWQSMTALSVPLVTLAMACLVGFIALALFIPLVDLINALADSIA